MYNIRVKKLKEKAKLPTYGSADAAGADLYACLDDQIAIAPGETVFIPTGLSMEIPKGHAGLICARSGMACKRGLAPANKVGIIDSDYRGEFIVVLHNHGHETQSVAHGERIAQLLIVPVMRPDFIECDELDNTVRAGGGFGSTGN